MAGDSRASNFACVVVNSRLSLVFPSTFCFRLVLEALWPVWSQTKFHREVNSMRAKISISNLIRDGTTPYCISTLDSVDFGGRRKNLEPWLRDRIQHCELLPDVAFEVPDHQSDTLTSVYLGELRPGYICLGVVSGGKEATASEVLLCIPSQPEGMGCLRK